MKKVSFLQVMWVGFSTVGLSSYELEMVARCKVNSMSPMTNYSSYCYDSGLVPESIKTASKEPIPGILLK